MNYPKGLGESAVGIQRFIGDKIDSNSWLIVEDNCGLLIDAVDNRDLYEAIKPLDELTVVLTHSHFDHIIGLNHIRKLIPAINVISTKRCSENIGNRFRNMSYAATAFMQFYKEGEFEGTIDPFVCSPSDDVFEGEKRFEWHGHTVILKAVYGHSDDGLIALVDNSLFSGDTLLHIPTVTRFPTGSKERFWGEDIPMLSILPGIDMVYPGHGPSGTVKDMIGLNRRKITGE